VINMKYLNGNTARQNCKFTALVNDDFVGARFSKPAWDEGGRIHAYTHL
jgi:hypothetical protein